MIVVDSCKLRIPLERCKVLNDSLLSHWIPMEMNQETGELRDVNSDYKTKAYRHNSNGISTRVALEKQVTGDGSKVEYLTIGLNAKQLQERYFEGITEETIPDLYRYVMSLDLFSCTLQDFKAGEVTDCDFRKDFTCDDVDSLTYKLEQMTIPKRKKGEGCKRYSKADNKGIEWSDRKTTAISTAPFVKLYSKQLDMERNSKDFSSNHLEGQDYTNRTRIEFTIKNRKHFRKYGVTDTSLENIVRIDQERLQKMLTDTMSKHIEKPVRAAGKKEGISTSEQEMINIIYILIQHKVGLNEARSAWFGNLKRNTRSRREQLFDKVWKEHFSKLPQVKQLDKVEMWLNQIGVQFL